MLDSDASFFLVPEFQSSRGARRTLGAPYSNLRFDAAPGADLCMALMPDPGTLGVAAKADITATGANAVPTDTDTPDFLDLIAADSPEPLADTYGEDAADFFSFDEDAADLFTMEDAPEDSALSTDSPDIRSVTPRRPMRFTFARGEVEHSRLILPIPNLFENTFEDDTLTGPGIDPRLQRSRARARARLTAHEAALPPEARNLWCDDGSDEEMPTASQVPLETEADSGTITLTETTANDGTDGHAPRRAVRHLSVTRRTPKPRLSSAEIHDPLQDHLHQVRDALYSTDPEEEAAALASPHQHALPLRLAATLVTLAFLLVQVIAALRAGLPDRARALRDTLLGNSLRLPSRALAITGMILAIAQTIPPDLM
jgi:hypothetical protein